MVTKLSTTSNQTKSKEFSLQLKAVKCDLQISLKKVQDVWNHLQCSAIELLPTYLVMNQGDAVCLWNYCAPRCWCWGAFRFTPMWILLLSRGVHSVHRPLWCVHCGCFLRWVHGPLWCVYGGSTLLLAPVPRPHPLIIRYRTPPPICPPTPSQTFRMELGPSVSFQTSSTVLLLVLAWR